MAHKRIQISRRSLLKTCSLAAAATGLPLWFVERSLAQGQPAAAPPDANDRPNIALIGCGGMGMGNAQEAARFGNLIAVCDPDESHLNRVRILDAVFLGDIGSGIALLDVRRVRRVRIRDLSVGCRGGGQGIRSSRTS